MVVVVIVREQATERLLCFMNTDSHMDYITRSDSLL